MPFKDSLGGAYSHYNKTMCTNSLRTKKFLLVLGFVDKMPLMEKYVEVFLLYLFYAASGMEK